MLHRHVCRCSVLVYVMVVDNRFTAQFYLQFLVDLTMKRDFIILVNVVIQGI